MVEVALGGGHPASGEDAGTVPGFDAAALRRGGAASGCAVMHGETGAGVGDREPPLAIGLCLGDLAGYVGYYWSESGEVSGSFGQAGKGL